MKVIWVGTINNRQYKLIIERDTFRIFRQETDFFDNKYWEITTSDKEQTAVILKGLELVRNPTSVS